MGLEWQLYALPFALQWKHKLGILYMVRSMRSCILMPEDYSCEEVHV